jgi:hypothetical protein
MAAKSQILKDLMDNPVPVPKPLYDRTPIHQQPTLKIGVVTPNPESKRAARTVVSPPNERSEEQQAQETAWETLDVMGDALGPMDDTDITVNQMDERHRSDSYNDSIDDMIYYPKDKEVGIIARHKQ